jgi:hypothetical protein
MSLLFSQNHIDTLLAQAHNQGLLGKRLSIPIVRFLFSSKEAYDRIFKRMLEAYSRGKQQRQILQEQKQFREMYRKNKEQSIERGIER